MGDGLALTNKCGWDALGGIDWLKQNTWDDIRHHGYSVQLKPIHIHSSPRALASVSVALENIIWSTVKHNPSPAAIASVSVAHCVQRLLGVERGSSRQRRVIKTKRLQRPTDRTTARNRVFCLMHASVCISSSEALTSLTSSLQTLIEINSFDQLVTKTCPRLRRFNR